jgi:hypothetical protein
MSDFGVNFRNTLAYISDTGINVYMPFNGFNANYPQPLSNGLTCGWETCVSGMDARDRSTSIDERLAGLQFTNSQNTSCVWRADLPATGTFNIRAAFGDENFGAPYAYVEYFDTNTSLANPVNDADGTNNDEFYDATGVLRVGNATWVSSNAAKSLTFSTTLFRIKLQPGTSVAGATRICHVRITSSGAAATGFYHQSQGIWM